MVDTITFVGDDQRLAIAAAKRAEAAAAAVDGLGPDISAVAAIADDITLAADNIAEIQAAPSAAATATTQAGIATAKATEAAGYAGVMATASATKDVTLGFATALIPNGSAWPNNSAIWAVTCPNACTLKEISTQIGTVGTLDLVVATGTLGGVLTKVASYALATPASTGLKKWTTANGDWAGTISIPAGGHLIFSLPATTGAALIHDTALTGFNEYSTTGGPFSGSTKTLSLASNRAIRVRALVAETSVLQVPRAGLIDNGVMDSASISAEPATRVVSQVTGAYNATMAEPGAGVFSNNQIGTIGTVDTAGPLGTVTVDVATINSGSLDLLVLSGTAPDFEIVSSTTLTVTSSGSPPYRNVFTSAQFGTINLKAGQTLAWRLPSGGPILYNVPKSGNTFYYNSLSVMASGAARLTAVNNSIIRSKFTASHPSIVIGPENVGASLRGLSELATPDAPTTFVMFLTGGQSNMQGNYGVLNPFAIPSGVAYQYYSGALTPVTSEPIGNSTGTSMLVAFANRFFALTGMGVIFVPSAVGGSGLAVSGITGNWSSTGALRGTAISNLNAAIAAAESASLAWQFGGVLWAQGETDGDTIDSGGNALTGGLMTQAKYETEFGLLLSYLQTQTGLGTSMPFIISALGTKNTGASAGYTAIRAAHMNLPHTYPNVFIGFTGAKNFNARSLMADTYHYLPQGYAEMGRAMATTAAFRCVGKA